MTGPIVRAAVLLMSMAVLARAADPPKLEWAGSGSHRITLRVDPPADIERNGDERPADVAIDFQKLLADLAPGRTPDLATLQIFRQDATTGRAIEQTPNAFARQQHELPLRWYDAAIPYEFPEVEGNLSSTDGELRYQPRTRLGYFFNCLGDWQSGRLAFPYRREAQPAWYGVYFNLLAEGQSPQQSPPRGFLGDGMQRCEPEGDSSTGMIHSRVALADMNGDGRFDLVVGCGRGGMVWYANRGTPGEPTFSAAQLVFTADGKPADVGWSSSPHAVDWDGDGLFDLLSGAGRNRLVLYRNRGTKERPSLEYMGLVKTDDGRPLSLPTTPVPEGPDVFKTDYHPVVDTVDWDGDGDWDLLAGGYTTGRVFLYENIGTASEPKLRLVGPLEADGEPLDVGWCAAPCAADFDGDGDLDLISGCMPMHRRDGADSDRFLHYFRNDGTRREPRLTRVPFPKQGTFPRSALASPRAIDWSGDGLVDLVVSSGKQIYLYRNVGAAARPLFDADAKPLANPWGDVPLAVGQMLDWNGDGKLDMSNALRVYLNSGRGSPGVFGSPAWVLKPGQAINHLSGIGDDWRYQRLYDLDSDGLVDVLDADHAGTIWWHKSRTKPPLLDVDTAGVQLQQTDGKPVQVGFDRQGFDALQGARATYTVGDMDGDGRQDLIVVDTFGIVRYFRQARPGPPPVFELPVQLGKLPIRGAPCAADWNGDGRLDVIAGSDASRVYVFLNTGDPQQQFGAQTHLKLPPAPYGAGTPLVAADYNGDGDVDLLVQTAYGYTCFYERSFVENGYAQAEVVTIEERP